MWNKLKDLKPSYGGDYLLRFDAGTCVVASWDKERNIFEFDDCEMHVVIDSEKNGDTEWMDIPGDDVPVTVDDLMDSGLIDEQSLMFESPSFDDAIIGASDDFRVIYDYDKMVECLMRPPHNMSSEEAVDFICYNTLDVHASDESHFPIVMHKPY